MLGKIMETYFEKDCYTSWVIDALEQKTDDKYYYDTLKLLRVFHLRMASPIDNNTHCFAISLYVKRDEDCKGNSMDSKLTLSKIKKACVEKYFNQDDVENEVLLPVLINEMGSIDFEQKTQDIMFETTITFKAQALVNWSERGKTKTYHIVGMSLEKVI